MAQTLMATSHGTPRKKKAPAKNERHAAVVKQLVTEHAKRKDEPLILAIWFQTSDPNNIHLLEVIKYFPGPASDELFSIESELPPELAIRGHLHLTLANKEQLWAAIDRSDPSLTDLDMDAAQILHPASLKPGTWAHQAVIKLKERRRNS
ncbi:MAG TPA: hypothetical protein PKW11_13245 [Pseudomonadota bacterium]|nr:hypothetical protein [Pseudomonadota bacterium]